MNGTDRTVDGERPRRLCILSVSYPFARTGRDAVGGAEQVLARVDAVLVRGGHRSVVVAPRGSAAAGELIETEFAQGEITDEIRAQTHARHRAAIARALEEHPVDLVHMHGVDFHHYLPSGEDTPVLATLHLPPSWYPAEIFERPPPHLFLHCVSDTQRGACPPGARLLPSVANGVPVEEFGGPHARRDFALMLGRVCPEKGLHLGLEAARRAGVSLLLGGEVFPYPEHRRYYEERLRPLLDARRRFLGPVGFARKRRLLAAARCVLIPSLVPETSSLVAMEAIASGTPVIAFPSGALAEVVEHGRTGFLVRNAQEMAEAIHAVHSLDAEECQAVARERFSEEAMVARYLALYARVLAEAPPRIEERRRPSPPPPPIGIPARDS